MGKFVRAGNTGEFHDGGTKKIIIEGQEILLARVGADYFAIANRCPHMGGDLSKGKLEGTVVTCPRHGSQFDVRTGEVLRWTRSKGVVSALSKAIKSPRPVATYKVKVEGEKISIEI